MKKFLTAVTLLFLLISACQKPPLAPPSSSQDPSQRKVDYLPGGGTTPSSGGQVSGASMMTGYEQLTKHLVDGTWDGTYDFSWYNYTFNVSISAYLLNGTMGDPVSFSFNGSSPAFQSGAGYPSGIMMIGSGYSAFAFTYVLTTLSSFMFYDDEYSANGLENWAAADLAYFTYKWQMEHYDSTPGAPPPVAPPPSPIDSVVALSGTNMVVNVTGKFIRIIPGPSDQPDVPYAVAELSWSPVNDNYFCNNKCKFCTTHPNDPSCLPPPGTPEP
jgi:hypothetical protein